MIFEHSTTNKTATVSKLFWYLNFWKILIFKWDMTIFWDTLQIILLHSVTPYWVCTKENMMKLHTILNKSQKLIHTSIIGFYKSYIFEYIQRDFRIRINAPDFFIFLSCSWTSMRSFTITSTWTSNFNCFYALFI